MEVVIIFSKQRKHRGANYLVSAMEVVVITLNSGGTEAVVITFCKQWRREGGAHYIKQTRGDDYLK